MSKDTVTPPALHTLNALDIVARLDTLASDLRQAQREIDALRRRRGRPSAWSVAVLLTVATSTFGLGLSAQGRPLQTGDFWAPFHIFGDDRVLGERDGAVISIDHRCRITQTEHPEHDPA